MLNEVVVFGWASSVERWAIAAAVTIAFALLARALRGVDQSGMFAGGAACFLIFAGTGPAGFAVLAMLFLLTWVATRFGYRRKQDLGVAERGDGRDAWQVLANLAVPAVASAAFSATGNRAFLFAAAAALAEAAIDTVASEIGQTRRTAVLITTGKPVPAGTDGGITLPGTAAGALAGAVIGLLAAAGGMIPWPYSGLPWVAGFVGMLADSVLGATVQSRGWISNGGVNLLSTFIAAVLAYAIAALSS